jgi:hypothetical protein
MLKKFFWHGYSITPHVRILIYPLKIGELYV